MKRSTFFAAISIAFIVVDARSARAQDDALDSAYEARFREGVAYLKQSKFEQARIDFLQTLGLAPNSPKVLLNLALSEVGLKRYVDALTHFKAYFANPKTDPKKAEEVRRTVYAEAWAATGHVRVQADRGDSLVLDDGTKLGNAPLSDPVDVTPGKHRLATGGRSVEFAIAAGETKDVGLASQAVKPPEPLPSPHEDLPPPEVQTGVSTGRVVTTASLGAAAVAGVVLGFVFHSKAVSAAAESRDVLAPVGGCNDVSSPQCTRASELKVDRDRDDTLSTVSFVGAVVLGAAAIATGVFWPKPSSDRQNVRALGPRVLPRFNSSSAGADVVFRF